jgi:hypothetical protein
MYNVHICFGEFGLGSVYKFGLADKKIKKNGIPEKEPPLLFLKYCFDQNPLN